MVDPAPRALTTALAFTVVAASTLPALVLSVSMTGFAVGTVTAALLTLTSLLLGGLAARAVTRTLPPSGRVAPPEAIAAAILIAIVAAWHLWVAWQRPVIDWDGLYYHVPALHGWLREGRVSWLRGIDDVPFVNGYPMALEVMGFVMVRLLDHDRWIDALNLLLWPVGALGAAFTAHVWGARRPWPAVAAVSFLAVPAWMVGSGTGYVDAGLASATCALVGLTAWRLQRVDHVPAAVVWGAAAGLVMGVKGTGILLAGVALVVLAVDALRRDASARRRAVRALALGAVVMTLTGGLWPARATWHTGNPIHPVQLRLGAKVLAPGTDAHAAAELSRPAELDPLPGFARPLVVWAWPFDPMRGYDRPDGLGPVWTLVALPSLLVLAWTGRRRREVIGALAVGAIVFAAQPAPWWSRLTLWVLAFGLPAFAAVVSRAAWARPFVVGATTLVLLGGAGLSAWSLAIESDRGRADGRYVSAAEYYFGELAAHPDWPAVSDAPAVARSDWGRVGSLLGGVLAQPAGRRAIHRIDHPRDVPPDVDWIVWDLEGAGALPGDIGHEWTVRGHPRDGFVLLRRQR